MSPAAKSDWLKMKGTRTPVTLKIPDEEVEGAK
jgi:hypothetical protein